MREIKKREAGEEIIKIFFRMVGNFKGCVKRLVNIVEDYKSKNYDFEGFENEVDMATEDSLMEQVVDNGEQARDNGEQVRDLGEVLESVAVEDNGEVGQGEVVVENGAVADNNVNRIDMIENREDRMDVIEEIVDINNNMDNESGNMVEEREQLIIHEEFNRAKTLHMKITCTERTALKWLRDNGLIAREQENCSKCSESGKTGILKLYNKKEDSKGRKKGGMYMRCKNRHEKTPFEGTFFDGNSCRIPCSKVLELVYHFSWKTPVCSAAREVGVTPKTAIDYYHYCREVCAVSMVKRGDNVIGGVGLIVEIDESKFFCRKYNRGRLLAGERQQENFQQAGWVFGGICRETKDVFMVRVIDRKRDTLYREIHKHIREGTTIISDEWRAYCTLEDEGYQHRTICHKRNFVSPDDPTVHTQNIECQWRQAKNCFPKNSTTEELRESYLQEYMYRKKYGKKNMVHKLIADIKLVYPYKR